MVGVEPSLAIVGLGTTDIGKIFGRTSADFALEAVLRAAEDAGVAITEIDGLLVSGGIIGGVDISLAKSLGMRDLALLSAVQSYGSTALAMVQLASMAILAGSAGMVACVFGDAPLQPGGSTGAAYAKSVDRVGGYDTLFGAAGVGTATARYALAARRHMERFGTTSEQFGAIAVSTRQWAAGNPLAQMTAPMTIEDHQSSRMVADPLRLFDCCLVSNGGVAVIVTTAERAGGLRKPPVHIWGWGQSHPGTRLERGSDFGLRSGAVESGQRAFKMAGVRPSQVDVCELYDCYTYTVVLTLEDYGFCEKGEGGPFAASGATGPGGNLPTNTGGGELSGYYMWGMTPLSEAVIQVRGEGGARQVDRHDLVLVSGNGGLLDHHATMILGKHPR
jgi:acetyl-CoA acetyltransferase